MFSLKTDLEMFICPPPQKKKPEKKDYKLQAYFKT